MIFILLSESTSVNRGTQIREHEETVQLSPSTVRKTTIYEAHRTIGAGQPVLGVSSTGFRTLSPVASSTISKNETTDEQQVEEKYEITLSSYDQSAPDLISYEPLITAPAPGEGYFENFFRVKYLFKIYIDLNLMKKCTSPVLSSMNHYTIKMPIRRKWYVSMI